MFAFVWPELGHSMINVISAVPPDMNFTVPPNEYAASIANKIVPGSVKFTSGAQRDRTSCDPW